MDRPEPVMMNEGAFQTANGFSSAEIWPFGGEGRGGLDLRRLQFGPGLGLFAENAGAANRDAPAGDGLDPMVLDGRGARKRREEEDVVKCASTSSAGNDMNECESKRHKTSGSRDEKAEAKAEREVNSGKGPEQDRRPADPPKQDYIHVRARRGQATDSHSLAERARREKISERMRILQDLVPGCSKVIGKALVLDEIINYIQSLQRQVEFLSMKLEAVNSGSNPSIEGFPSKDVSYSAISILNVMHKEEKRDFKFGQQTFDMEGVAFGSQATREYSRGSSPEWLHIQIGGSFERT
ncbi:hypothetical protein RJ639_041503 [Escallonia herrerae]|uniref:BHLH domain-containing protein n=1 Tax=Escallonia herrerae TaxID=1293975 RepID=A0AA89B3A5_9ASTE|nr:hypothetical protein RJ639_041503 [Escallonia herrerae]